MKYKPGTLFASKKEYDGLFWEISLVIKDDCEPPKDEHIFEYNYRSVDVPSWWTTGYCIYDYIKTCYEKI